MKKIILAMSLCLCTTFLFSFKSSSTASTEIENMDNYKVNDQNTKEFLGLYKEYQDNGNELMAIPTCNLLRAGVRYATAVWTATCRAAFWEAVDVLLGPSIQHTPEDIQTAEQIGLISRL